MADTIAYVPDRSTWRLHAVALILTIITGMFVAGCSDEEVATPLGNGGNGNPTDTVFYSDVRPIFDNNCAITGCHAPGSEQLSLVLSDYDSILEGSANGAVVIPGDKESSELYLRITGVSTPQMPVGGSLTQAQIDSIGRWIDDGALE